MPGKSLHKHATIPLFIFFKLSNDAKHLFSSLQFSQKPPNSRIVLCNYDFILSIKPNKFLVAALTFLCSNRPHVLKYDMYNMVCTYY